MSWCSRRGLSVNPSKMAIVPFTNRRKLDGLQEPVISGTRIPFVKKVKHLGVILDSKLKWTEHVTYTCEKAKRVLWACRRVAGRSWGIRPSVAYWIYTMVVRPTVTYAALVWWHRCKLDCTKKQLDKLQRLGCLLVTGAMRSTPTRAMELLLDLRPLHLEVERMARTSAYKFKAQNLLSPLSCGGHRQIDIENEKLAVLQMPSDFMSPFSRTDRKFEVITADRDTAHIRQSNLSVRELHCFTDGSKTVEGVGAGVWVASRREMRISIPLGNLPTVFQAEVIGIKTCVEMLLRSGTSRARINIYTDSQAAIAAIEGNCTQSRIVNECRVLMDRLADENRVRLHWVPGHSGIPGNEEADQLARQGAKEPFYGPEPACGVSLTMAKTTISNWARAENMRIWNSIQTHKHAKRFLNKIDKNRTRALLSLHRKAMREVVALYTGHARMNKHLHNMGLATTSLCRMCGTEEETPLHVICYCIALARRRFLYFGCAEISDPGNNAEITPQKILCFVKDAGLL